MSLESATWATQLSAANPPGSDPRSQGDDHIRLMKAVMQNELSVNNRQWVYVGDSVTRASTTAFTVAGDASATYPADRRVKVVGSSTGTIYGSISSSTYSAATAVNVRFDSGSMSNEALAVYVSPLTNKSLPQDYQSLVGDLPWISSLNNIISYAAGVVTFTSGSSSASTLLLSPGGTSWGRITTSIGPGNDTTIAADNGNYLLLRAYNTGASAYRVGIKIDTDGNVYIGNSQVLIDTYVSTVFQGSTHRFVSSQQAYATTGSVAHGLGATPDLFEVFMRCTTTDLGYAVNDEVSITGMTQAGSSTGAAFWANSTNVGWAFDANRLPNKSTGAQAAFTTSSWVIVARAIRF